jgi:hypothetical protein
MATPNKSPFSPLSTNGAEIADVFGKFRAGISKGRKTSQKIQKGKKEDTDRQADRDHQVAMEQMRHGNNVELHDKAFDAAGKAPANVKSFKSPAGEFTTHPPVGQPTTVNNGPGGEHVDRRSETQTGPKPKRTNKKKLAAEMSTPASPTSTPVASNVASPFTSPA